MKRVLAGLALVCVLGACSKSAELGPVAQAQCSRLEAGYQSFKDAGDPNGQVGVEAGVSAINDMASYSDDPVLHAQAIQWLAAPDADTSMPAFNAILAECGIEA